MAYYISKRKDKLKHNIILSIVGGILILLLIVLFHTSMWSYHYAVVNPQWNIIKARDMAYTHFLKLNEWP